MSTPDITFAPEKQHTHTVIFLHGRGDNVQNFVKSLEYLQDSDSRSLPQLFPTFRWVFPEAPRQTSAGAMGSMWNQWFDIYNVRDFTEREELQAEGLRISVDRIRHVIKTEAQLLGGRYDKIILAGISQGAATLLHTWFNLDTEQDSNGQNLPANRRLGAFLGFSCRLPFTGRSLPELRRILNLSNVPERDEIIHNTPVLLEHCVDDLTVPVAAGRNLRDTLVAFNANVSWKEYPRGGHWFNSPQGVDDMRDFINKNVPSNI